MKKKKNTELTSSGMLAEFRKDVDRAGKTETEENDRSGKNKGKLSSAIRKIEYNAPVTLGFAVAALLVLGLDVITGGWTTRRFFMVYPSSWHKLLTYVRMFGHVLGHADLSHYVNNMMMLLLVGPIVEQRYGSRDLLFMIAVTAGITGLLNNLFFGSSLLGASGIVFMLIVMASATGMHDGKIPLTMILVVVLYLGEQVFTMITVKNRVSEFAHIIGGVCGCIFGWMDSQYKEKKRGKEA